MSDNIKNVSDNKVSKRKLTLNHIVANVGVSISLNQIRGTKDARAISAEEAAALNKLGRIAE